MVFLTIILFFVYTFGIGFSVTRFVKESENLLERNLMRVGLGLASMITLGLFLNIIRVPLDWRIFLILSLIIPLFYLFKNIKAIKALNFKFRLTKYDLSISVMLLIFFATFYMYASGAFSYPWLEDDDSWGHALGVKYVAVEKTVFAEKPLRYIDPYPPSYDMVLGILHQTNNSVYWTLKFFNALIISLSIIFFFFFVKELAGRSKALFSTFVLASIPAYLSHFIWAISLSMPLYFVAFYAAEKIKDDKKWFIVAALAIGAVLTVSPSHTAYFGALFAIYYAIKAIVQKNFLVYHAAAGVFGVVVSFLWWLPTIVKHGLAETLKGLGSPPEVNVLTTAGTADRIYSFADFFIAQKQNMINNPIGVGVVVTLLVVIALVSLILKYHNEIIKNKMAIFVIFVFAVALMLFFLSGTYTKYVPKRNVAALEPGSVPFLEFLSDQTFFVTFMSIILFVLVFLIIINYKNYDFKDGYIIIILAWLIFTFYAVNASPFYYKLTPFRVWSILAIPLAIIASEGLILLMQLFERFRIPQFVIVTVIAMGILLTSAYQKYTVNTAQWPPGGFWTSFDEVMGYVWVKDNLQKNSPLFTFVNNGPVIGTDMYTCHWCSDVQNYQRNGFNQSVEQNYNWLKKEKYRYIVVDGQTARKFGANETNTKIQELIKSNKFKPAFNNNGLIVLEIL